MEAPRRHEQDAWREKAKGQEEQSRRSETGAQVSWSRRKDRKVSFSRSGTQAHRMITATGTANQMKRVEETDNSRRCKIVCLGVRTSVVDKGNDERRYATHGGEG